MIIDLLNAGRHYAGTEANILFHLQQMEILVPSFFCITEDYTEDELNNYLQNHFQYTQRFTVRLSISMDTDTGEEVSVSEYEAPHYVDVPKSMIVRYADRLFSEAKEYAQLIYPDRHENVTAYVIVQEMVYATVFGKMQTACPNGPLNETVITIGEGHNSDFAERGVPYSIYCHNDTDNILFAYEPDNAVVANNDLIQGLLRRSDKLKERFGNCNLSIKFLADYDKEKLYFVSVQEISELNRTDNDEIMLDTKGISDYYPGVTMPLRASAIMSMLNRILNYVIQKTGNSSEQCADIMEHVEYVNGRLYFNVKKFRELQKVLSLDEDTEGFVNRSGYMLLRHIFMEQGIKKWHKKRSVALKLNKILEDNLKNGRKLCDHLDVSLKKVLSAGERKDPSDEYIHDIFDEIIKSLSECMSSLLLNTLHIKLNQELLSRHMPGERKYAAASEKIEAGLALRKKLREYHKAFYRKLNEYGLMTGEAFKQLGVFKRKEDILLLTYDETLALKNGELDNISQLIEERRREFDWYKSLPGFTHLVFSKEIMNAPPGKVSFVKSVRENCFIRGSGLVSGKTRLPAVVCDESHLPDNCDSDHIYVMQYLPDNVGQYTVGGIVVEDPDVFADLDPEVENCGYPIVCGAEHCCVLAETGDFIEIDGSVGEVCIIRMSNSGK